MMVANTKVVLRAVRETAHLYINFQGLQLSLDLLFRHLALIDADSEPSGILTSSVLGFISSVTGLCALIQSPRCLHHPGQHVSPTRMDDIWRTSTDIASCMILSSRHQGGSSRKKARIGFDKNVPFCHDTPFPRTIALR
jgi:hypothetical protein